jgi:hypothetical protein
MNPILLLFRRITSQIKVHKIQGQIQDEDPLMAGKVAHTKQDFLAVL